MTHKSFQIGLFFLGVFFSSLGILKKTIFQSTPPYVVEPILPAKVDKIYHDL